MQSRRTKPSEGRLTTSRAQEAIHYGSGKPGLLHSKVQRFGSRGDYYPSGYKTVEDITG